MSTIVPMSTMSGLEFVELREAARKLETQSLAMKVADRIGVPVETLLHMLPKSAQISRFGVARERDHPGGSGHALLGIGLARRDQFCLGLHLGFDATPFGPQQTFRRAEGEQAERLLAGRGGHHSLARGVAEHTRFIGRGVRGSELDPVRLRPRLAIMLGEHGIDGEEPHRRRRRRRKRGNR